MARSDDLLIQLMESLSAEGCETAGDEPRMIELVHKMRRARDLAIRDREAARLLPLGRAVAAERLHVAESTVYKMTHRHTQRFSTVKQQA